MVMTSAKCKGKREESGMGNTVCGEVKVHFVVMSVPVAIILHSTYSD